MPKVKIHEQIYDGYEREYLLGIVNSNKRVWAHGLEHDNYIASGFEKINEEVMKECDFSIEWVTKIMEADFDSDELIQDVEGSSHITCKVTVTKVVDSDSFECFSESLGTIVVELENDIDFIDVGSKVSFVGNLHVDFD